MIAQAPFRAENYRLPFQIFNYDFLDSVVKQITNCQPASYSRNFQCIPTWVLTSRNVPSR